MENREQIPATEPKKNFQKSSIKKNPTRHNRTNLGGNSDVEPGHDDGQITEFDSGNTDTEIDPGQLDRKEVDLDRTGKNNSKDTGPQEFKSQASARKANDAKLEEAHRVNLLGQGGYGTSGTSGTNSGPNQGYQSGLGPAGSQNGSTGYNAGSLGVKPVVKE